MSEIKFTYIDTTTTPAPNRLPHIDLGRNIGTDIETANEDRTGGAIEPWDGDISTVQLSDGEETIVLDVLPPAGGVVNENTRGWFRLIADLVNDKKIIKIAHNAKFEMKWFMYHLGAEPESFYDTFLGSQMIVAAGDPYAKHDLGTVADVFTSIQLDKGEQTSNWGARPLKRSQLVYAAWDAAIVPHIFPQQVARLKADDLLRAAELEMNALRPIVRAELNGFHIDQDRWSELLVEKKAILARLHGEMLDIFQRGVDWTSPNPDKRGKRPTKPKKPVDPRRAKANKGRDIPEDEVEEYQLALQKYHDDLWLWQMAHDKWDALPAEIPATLNPSSPDQMKKVISNVTGLKLASTNTDKVLVNYVDKFPEIAKLVEYREYDKAVSSYGDNLLRMAERDGRLHTDFKQIKDTGRMGSAKPNLQQIPHDEPHRRCFTAPPGSKLVIADYSQIELRILAELARDEAFIADFNSGIDMHIKGASRFFRLPIEEVTKELRNYAKRVNFGVVYGIMGVALSRQINSTEAEAENLIASYFNSYPGNKAWLDRAALQMKTLLFARTMSGRIQRATHDGSRGQINAIGRNGMNMPIQGTSADMLKRALYFLDLAIRGSGVKLVNIVHDELVLEAPEHKAEWAADVLKASMERAGREYITVVPVPVEAMISDEWVKE